MCINCRYCKDDECLFEDFEDDEKIDEYNEENCPHFVETNYDPYREWIKDEDAKLHYQERLME